MIARERHSHFVSVDTDETVRPANRLSGKSENLLDERNAERQVAAIG
jgi:hypothetical protein